MNFIQRKSAMISEKNINHMWRNILYPYWKTSNMSSMFS